MTFKDAGSKGERDLASDLLEVLLRLEELSEERVFLVERGIAEASPSNQHDKLEQRRGR